MLRSGRTGAGFDYGRFECDTGLAYRSAIAYGRIRSTTIGRQDPLLRRTAGEIRRALGRPKNFYPRLDEVTVYALGVERVTGKHCPLPPPAEPWPARDGPGRRTHFRDRDSQR